MNWTNQFKYGDADSIEYQKHVIDTFVNAAYLTYNFKSGTETITMKDIKAAYGSDMTLVSPPNKKSPNLLLIEDGFGLFVFLR